MEEKRQDLDAERQKEILQRLLGELSSAHHDFYYKSTIDVAYMLKNYIKDGARLNVDERSLLERMSQRDIQLRLSLQ